MSEKNEAVVRMTIDTFQKRLNLAVRPAKIICCAIVDNQVDNKLIIIDTESPTTKQENNV